MTKRERGRLRRLAGRGLDAAADVVSGLARRRPWLLRELPRLPAPLRSRLAVALAGEDRELSEVLVDRDGVRLRLDLSDDVQRSIFLRVYERRELTLAQGLVAPGDTCIDVGANVGLYACHIGRAVGPEGRVHAFEPDPDNVGRLKANVELNSLGDVVEVHAAAVSDRAGSAPFFRHSRTHSGWGSLERHPDHRRSLDVSAVTLDAFLSEGAIEEVALLKIDVEGAEHRVVRGATEALRRGTIRHILLEWNGYWLQRTGADPSATLDLLAHRGYETMPLNRRRLDHALRHGTGDVLNLHFRRTDCP